MGVDLGLVAARTRERVDRGGVKLISQRAFPRYSGGLLESRTGTKHETDQRDKRCEEENKAKRGKKCSRSKLGDLIIYKWVRKLRSLKFTLQQRRTEQGLNPIIKEGQKGNVDGKST